MDVGGFLSFLLGDVSDRFVHWWGAQPEVPGFLSRMI